MIDVLNQVRRVYLVQEKYFRRCIIELFGIVYRCQMVNDKYLTNDRMYLPCRYRQVCRSGIANHGYEFQLLFEFLRVLFQYNLKIFCLGLQIQLVPIPSSILSVPVEYNKGGRYGKPIAGILVIDRSNVCWISILL